MTDDQPGADERAGRIAEQVTDEQWATVATRHQVGGDELYCITCEDAWPCPEIVVLREYVRLRAADERAERAEQALADIKAGLESMEWRQERAMSGALKPFCPVCGGTPSVHRMNPKTSRPDGHWLDGILQRGECPLALVLDRVRALNLQAATEATGTGGQ